MFMYPLWNETHHIALISRSVLGVSRRHSLILLSLTETHKSKVIILGQFANAIDLSHIEITIYEQTLICLNEKALKIVK